MDPELYFYGGNMQLNQFAAETGKSTDTIADWRKRGMLGRIGQPHPNRDGRWMYAKVDAVKVHIAGIVKERGGCNWETALKAGDQISDCLFGWKQNFNHYNRYLFVFGSDSELFCFSGSNAEEAFEAKNEFFRTRKSNVPEPTIGRVLDLEDIFLSLPHQYQENLLELKAMASK